MGDVLEFEITITEEWSIGISSDSNLADCDYPIANTVVSLLKNGELKPIVQDWLTLKFHFANGVASLLEQDDLPEDIRSYVLSALSTVDQKG